MSRKEIKEALAEGWGVGAIEPPPFEVWSDLKDFSDIDGGPKAWFVLARRATIR